MKIIISLFIAIQILGLTAFATETILQTPTYNTAQVSEFKETAEIQLGLCLGEDYSTDSDRRDLVFFTYDAANKKCSTSGLRAEATSSYKFESFCRKGYMGGIHLYVAASAYFKCVTPVQGPPVRDCSYGKCDPYLW